MHRFSLMKTAQADVPRQEKWRRTGSHRVHLVIVGVLASILAEMESLSKGMTRSVSFSKHNSISFYRKNYMGKDSRNTSWRSNALIQDRGFGDPNKGCSDGEGEGNTCFRIYF